MSDGWSALLAALADGLAPDLELPIDEWADAHMIIPRDSGANEYGRYRTSRTPHAREVMRWLSPTHPCKRVALKGASQMLKTQVALNFLGASIHQAPSNFLWIVPTGSLVKRASIRIDKTIREVDVLAERVATKRSRDALNNLTAKEYPGGTLHIVTAGAAANLSEVSARYVVFDEIDRSEDNVGSEGAPGALAEARQTTFESNRKTYYPSSPTIEGASAIDALYASGTQREALAECIHCGHLQPLVFERLIRSDDGAEALYPCVECGGIHHESDKTRMFARGAWSDGVAGDGETESATISQMFLPYGWMPWVGLMRLYEKAKTERERGNDNDMIVFYNTRLARCWAPDKEETRYDQLLARVEPYDMGTVPAGAAVLTAAVDTQLNRLEFKVVGWGPGMEGWIVDYQVIYGSPADEKTWRTLDDVLNGKYRHAGGQMLDISCAFVDSGGHFTQEVYNYTRARRRRSIFAIKGASRPNRPIISSKPTLVDITGPRGEVEKRGAQMWMIGTDTAKDYLAARWKKSEGPGAIHFSKDLDERYFRGLTAEYRRGTWKRGHRVTVWEKKSGDPNEPGDLMVYNVAAAHLLGLHKRSEYQWRIAFDRLAPPEPDAAPEKPKHLDQTGAQTRISIAAMARFQGRPDARR